MPQPLREHWDESTPLNANTVMAYLHWRHRSEPSWGELPEDAEQRETLDSGFGPRAEVLWI